jgi:hypothetical protein
MRGISDKTRERLCELMSRDLSVDMYLIQFMIRVSVSKPTLTFLQGQFVVAMKTVLGQRDTADPHISETTSMGHNTQTCNTKQLIVRVGIFY